MLLALFIDSEPSLLVVIFRLTLLGVQSVPVASVNLKSPGTTGAAGVVPCQLKVSWPLVTAALAIPAINVREAAIKVFFIIFVPLGVVDIVLVAAGHGEHTSLRQSTISLRHGQIIKAWGKNHKSAFSKHLYWSFIDFARLFYQEIVAFTAKKSLACLIFVIKMTSTKMLESGLVRPSCIKNRLSMGGYYAECNVESECS